MAENGSLEDEFLYHIKRTIIDFAQDRSGATRTIDILGTFTDLNAAKNAAREALASEGYNRDDFETFEVKEGTEDWSHNDGILVFAKAPAGQEFHVRLDTKSNVLHFKGNESGEVEGFLHYVLQTTINYNIDRTGGTQITEVEGTYPTREAACDAAKTALLDQEITKEYFLEYDEKENMADEWPYGEECFVHAVAETGENFLVQVKAQPHSHQHHACSSHGGKNCECNCKPTERACKYKACKHENCN